MKTEHNIFEVLTFLRFPSANAKQAFRLAKWLIYKQRQIFGVSCGLDFISLEAEKKENNVQRFPPTNYNLRRFLFFKGSNFMLF